MNIVKLNIGLENNPYTYQKVDAFINWTYGIPRVARQQTGEYNGEPERTAVFLTSSSDDVETILKTVEILTELFTQDCIAVKINDVGYLVYNPEYKGEKFEFNNEYFIEP